MSLISRIRRCQAGGAAVEYALILPVFIILMVGGLSMGSVSMAANSLHYAVEDAARCAAVKTTVCSDSTKTTTYAQGRYSGPQISPQFSYSTAGCGHTVTATANYPVGLAVTTVNVPLSASACYP